MAIAETENAVSVARVGLRRVAPLELIRGDEELSRCTLVRALSEGSLARLLERAVGKRYPDKAAVYREGEDGAVMYLVLRGEVRLLARVDQESVDFGGAHRGELFGEDAALAGARTHSAVAVGEVDVLELPRDAFSGVAASEPRVQELLSALHAQRRAAQKEMSDFLGRW